MSSDLIQQTSLRSVLCSEDWTWDSTNANQILFKENGTGQLICRMELNVWIAAEFDWTSSTLDEPTQSVDNNPQDADPKPGQIGQFDITITLTKRRIEKLGSVDMKDYTINEALLTEEAFAPKKYNVALEKGNFVTALDARAVHELPHTPKYGLRLTFDTSPYPPREEWKNPGGAPDAMKFWEWRLFCGGKLAK